MSVDIRRIWIINHKTRLLYKHNLRRVLGIRSSYDYNPTMAPNFNGESPVIAPGSLVLVTGANGYIASHIADQLLEAGYKIRGTVRDAKKSSWLQELFDKKYGSGKFEMVVVEDMKVPGAFDEATKGSLPPLLR